MNEEKNTPQMIKEARLNKLYKDFHDTWRYLLSKWLIIVVFGLGFAGVGLAISFLIKPKYTANMAFVLVEKGSAGGGLASLASNFGLGGLLGAGSDNAFSGDNLLEIIKSRYAVEKALLTPITFENEEMTMIDAYIMFNGLHKKWQKSKKVELRSLSYPLEQKREDYTRMQDSVLYSVYTDFIKNEGLTVLRKDKNKGLVNVAFTSKNEVFSKLFIENLINQTIQFYIETRTGQSSMNIEKMEHTADSIKRLYEEALYSSASISQVNINTAFQTAAVPRIKQENNAQLYGAVYAEVLKNLETLKLEMARQAPIIQLIETPRYPLKKDKLGKMKALVIGGFTGGFLILIILLGKRVNFFNVMLKLFL